MSSVAAAASRRLGTRAFASSSSPPSTRKTKAADPSTSAEAHIKIPDFVKPRLKKIKSDIFEQLRRHGQFNPVLCEREKSYGNFPTMQKMTSLYFDRGGKMFRPTITLLMASAVNQEVAARRGQPPPSDDVTENQAKIAMIAEMIHVASLVHDDVIDESYTRRGKTSVNGLWGNKMAVLAGDFILARATQALCEIGEPRVIATMAKIIEDLVMGEFLQMSPALKGKGVLSREDHLSDRWHLYIDKSKRKTASLFANACRSVAMLADPTDNRLIQSAGFYGEDLGLAFQLIDDAIDYEVDEGEEGDVGKPIGVDLELGLLTGPILCTAQTEHHLTELLARGRSSNEIRKIVRDSGACERTRDIAKDYTETAVAFAEEMRTSNGAKEALVNLALSQLNRKS